MDNIQRILQFGHFKIGPAGVTPITRIHVRESAQLRSDHITSQGNLLRTRKHFEILTWLRLSLLSRSRRQRRGESLSGLDPHLPLMRRREESHLRHSEDILPGHLGPETTELSSLKFEV